MSESKETVSTPRFGPRCHFCGHQCGDEFTRQDVVLSRYNGSSASFYSSRGEHRGLATVCHDCSRAERAASLRRKGFVIFLIALLLIFNALK